MQDNADIVELCHEMLDAIAEDGGSIWDHWLRRIIVVAKEGGDLKSLVRSAYGGMGSFNDFVLGLDYSKKRDREKMTRFDELRSRLYAAAEDR